MDFRRVLHPEAIDTDEDPCKCLEDPLNCTTDCSSFFPPTDYVPPLPPPVSSSHHHLVLSTALIIIIVVLSSLFLVLTYYVLVTKFCIAWRRSRAPSIRDERDEGEGDGSMEPPVNYVWYINTVGLEQSVINAITICKYKKGDGLVEGTDCSVCLSEFLDDEDVRLLPNCRHAFHVSCIDTWLRSHVNCPLCRAHIVPNPAISSPQNLQVPNGNPVLENAQNVSSLDVVGEGQNLEDELTSEVETDDVKMMDVKNLNRGSSSGIRALSDLTGNFRADEYVLDVGAGEEMQPVRRSVSVDSSAALKMYSSFVTARQVTGNKKGSISERSLLKIIGNGARGSLFVNRPMPMKRSYSSSGNFFSKRHSKNRSFVLPL